MNKQIYESPECMYLEFKAQLNFLTSATGENITESGMVDPW